MVNSDILLKNGYKTYKNSLNKYSTQIFQKRIDDEKGKKYFINFNEYAPFGSKTDYSYELEVQFDFNGFTCNLLLFHNKNKTLEDYEKEIERIWTVLNAEYYEKYV